MNKLLRYPSQINVKHLTMVNVFKYHNTKLSWHKKYNRSTLYYYSTHNSTKKLNSVHNFTIIIIHVLYKILILLNNFAQTHTHTYLLSSEQTYLTILIVYINNA